MLRAAVRSVTTTAAAAPAVGEAVARKLKPTFKLRGGRQWDRTKARLLQRDQTHRDRIRQTAAAHNALNEKMIASHIDDATFQRFLFKNKMMEHRPLTDADRAPKVPRLAPRNFPTFTLTAAEESLYFGKGDGFS
eukprot:a841717_292.p2 GENE.a841717_292~~a841717_292.p2  ORF type:complete len:146 (+),score=49.02 a841717_292:35-439(+)